MRRIPTIAAPTLPTTKNRIRIEKNLRKPIIYLGAMNWENSYQRP
ncbi:hypothetical protein C943_01468 [Mariniradius saccharolyticus AK6]|uniref:Uncharacterized protein n=1 Tax=Mariniradius saccharolyticus AK6 TaxID=1239962 RepID=M7Y4M5_9BACT|nr:hypothetical protein C943_01468 [Mariniradius saccharolyticus AK6]